MSFRVIASGAVSGLGRGSRAYDFGSAGLRAQTALREDSALAAAGLMRPRCARAPLEGEPSDRATALLALVFSDIARELDALLPDWRRRRTGLSIGTSSGGMISAERFFSARAEGRTPSSEETRQATYFAPLDEAASRLGPIDFVKRSQVVAACASSTIAIGLGMRWLERGACELVLAGGYDAVGIFVAAGFEALRATSAALPQPFCRDRDGMLLGEGAAVIALSREALAPARFFLSGFGASADAVHITAPDREAGGLRRATAQALAEAGCPPETIDLVSAHATATPYNDAAEAKVIASLGSDPVVHPFKAQIGHTLGAAGVLELLAVDHAFERGLLPAACRRGELDPEATVRLLPVNTPGSPSRALKLSVAFGGVTAALVAERAPGEGRVNRGPRPVHLVAHARITEVDREGLSAATGMPRDRLARIDELGLLALSAVSGLVEACGREALEGAGVVAGYALATLDTNERFYHRLHLKGPRWVDPRLFPATSPNAGAGQIAIAYGLTGPNFAVNRGLDGGLEALEAACEIVAMGDAERMIVVSADDEGPAARAWLERLGCGRRHGRGAVALLIARGAGSPSVAPDVAAEGDGRSIGHLALVDWLARQTARRVP